MLGHVDVILEFRVVTHGTLGDATAVGLSTPSILQPGELSTRFRVCFSFWGCPGPLTSAVVLSTRRSPFHDRQVHDNRPHFSSSEVSHRFLCDAKRRGNIQN